MSAKHTPGPYEEAAHLLGWKYEPGMGGWINTLNPDHRRGSNWSDLYVARDAEDACFQDGIETEDEARSAIAKAKGAA